MITYNDVKSLQYNMSPYQLDIREFPNKNCLLVNDFLYEPLSNKHKGIDVGSENYLAESLNFFMKTKAIQESSFIPSLDTEAFTPMNPNSFVQYNLTKGDLVISKDSNIGESVILDKDYSTCMPCGAIYKLPVKKHKLYLFAFLKSHIFREQLDLMVPKGATIRHAGTKFLNCKIPLPTKKTEEIILLVEKIVRAIITRETLIREKTELIYRIISDELLNNQKNKHFCYEFPKYADLLNSNRIDASFYCEECKQLMNIIENYKGGYQSLPGLGYSIKRGQNLQIGCIGMSLLSKEKHKNYYTLIKPTNFSQYGTVLDYEYLGNSNELSKIEVGDIVFSAEGTIGKCVMFHNPNDMCITNIHGIVISKENRNIYESAYISSVLRFYKEKGLFDFISVGGQGGSLAKKYFDMIRIPIFPEKKALEISELYFNPLQYSIESNSESFAEKDIDWCKKAGILQLDETNKQLKNELLQIIDLISNSKEDQINC